MKDYESSNIEFRICHNFKYSIGRVWDNISDLVLLSDSEFQLGHVEDMKGEGTNKLNSEFNYIWYGSYATYLKTIEVSEKEDMKKIKWYGKIEEIQTEYEFSFTLYSNTSDNTTLVIWEYFPIKTKLDTKFINALDLLKSQLIKRWEHLIGNSTKELCQYESIIVRSTPKEILKIIGDWKKFSKVAPLIADRVEYLGDPLTVGTELQIYFNKQNLKCFLKIKHIEESQNSLKFYLECYDGKPKVPLQDIHFDIEKINEEICIITFKHIFKQDLKYEFVNSISKDKRIILKLLKQHLES